MPVSVLSYFLYDTGAREDTLIGLNPTLPSWLYERDVDILSQ